MDRHLSVRTRFLWSPRHLLLVDGVGALMTSASTGLLLATEVLASGIPSWVLWILASVAFGYACFDAVGVFYVSDPRPFLSGIAILNLVYCFITLVICCVFSRQLTWLGMIYFSLEAIVVIPLALWERRIALSIDLLSN